MKNQNLLAIIAAAMAFSPSVQAGKTAHDDNGKAETTKKTCYYSTYELSKDKWVYRPEYSGGAWSNDYVSILRQPKFLHLDMYCNPSYQNSPTVYIRVHNEDVINFEYPKGFPDRFMD
ncbi:hypothetical protein PspLS_04195 [Pyricularia sp. CBS 133598]|nr:hypothetical protein PspLS_04195 [Pyricularia sp. CBS 133598]